MGLGCNGGESPAAAATSSKSVVNEATPRDSAPPPTAKEPPAPLTPLTVAQYNAGLPAWRLTPETRAALARTSDYNLVLVVVDGLRGDMLMPLTPAGAARYPHLTALLRRSLRFNNGFSTAAGTDVGMTSVLTGRLHYLYRGRQTLARALRGAGIRTQGVYQTEVERWLGPAMCRQGHRGNRVLVNDPLRANFGSRATSRQVSDAGIRFIRRHGGERFFLWLHYFDVHEHHQVQLRTLSMPDEQEAKAPATARGRYELMVRHVDHHMGRFFTELAQQGLADKTIVVFTADHGEGLSESPRLPAYHGELLYQPLVHVPLAVHIPGVPERQMEIPASTSDIYPTLLELAGISAPSKADGLNLAPLLLQTEAAPFNRVKRPIFLMESHQQALVQWPLKLIAWQDSAKVELYDLASDPEEKQDLSARRPEAVLGMTTLLSQRQLHRVDRRHSYIKRVLRERAQARRAARKKKSESD